MMRLLEAAIVPLFLGASLTFAAAAPYAQFTSAVNLVEVYATVTDSQGRPITGLTAADFAIGEDGAPQRISAFAAGEFPLSVAIGLDRSFSMAADGSRLSVAKSAARSLVGALREHDQVMIVAIGGETAIVAPLSPDRGAALSAIERLDAWGTTPLYDATVAALDAIQPARGRRALVLLSDGTDRYSGTTAAGLLAAARNHDVLVYPVAIGAARPPVFAELASATGGRSFFVRDPAALIQTMTAIARELRVQYLLGYVPTRDRAGARSWHAIEVTVARQGLHVRARNGYFGR
jgi:Ca-activated chloride channel homolog